ncbi:MAG TPA: ABC transporter ATP-binding protein [Opitutaceae bacterium]|nr:ABC transporter ATP-binding protein [Opitutaceae bacterium]
MSGPVVQLAGVGKRFGAGPRVLSGIDLAVSEGEFVSLIGPSGCGKSTLLRLIAGLIAPSEGTVRVRGAAPAQARGSAFFVFQDPTLLPWRRVAANVALPLELRGAPAAERRRRVGQMLELVGLQGAVEQYPWQLSGGMRMRVSIARALSVAPRLLFLDEPFGALDEMTRDRLDEDLLRIRERDPFTAFFVTHSVAEAVFLSTRILVLAAQPGRIAASIDVPFSGPRRAELRESPEFLRTLAETSRALRAAAKGAA